ncbi:MAG TPA: radical SAM family heme chaperone HemW [Balneolaceae bacterium]|nr:radical SAM family heme chaperone HemW [Balneolaceae bacterium]
MAGIYIHIPFCKQACSYCDFYFVTRKKLIDPFVDSLLKEIQSYRGTPYSDENIETIYLGGGTPSQLSPDQLKRIFDALQDAFSLDPVEVTMEMNPDDVTPDYLKSLLDLGINRASMGVQSFDEKLLQFMHRAHTKKEALKALESLQTAGFPTFTADLIYGNPGQTLEMLDDDITQLLQFDPPHISAYSLTVEPQTRLGKQVKLGRISPPEDDLVAEHFDLLSERLKRAGIERYEVSNFSKPGKEAVHNSNYWRHKNYLGLGPSAHSFWLLDDGALRWENRSDIKEYMDDLSDGSTTNPEKLSMFSLAEERLMLGLRTKWGVGFDELKSRYNYELNQEQITWLEYQQEKGMLKTEGDVLRFTSEGLKIADLLIVDLLSKS